MVVKRKRFSTSRVAMKRTQREQNTQTPSNRITSSSGQLLTYNRPFIVRTIAQVGAPLAQQGGYLLSNVASRAAINMITGPLLSQAPSGSIHKPGVSGTRRYQPRK